MPARRTSAAAAAPDSARMLCGVTGTEFLTVTLGATPDMLEFVPAKPAWRIPPAADSQTDPAYFDTTATTSWGQLVAAEGTYISQPERAPLYNQKDATPALLAGAAPASGLTVHVLDYFPVVSWSAATQGSAPAVPMVPYAGLDFASNPNLDPASYRDMESRAINPKRADMFLTTAATMTAANAARPSAAAARHVAARHDAARACWPSSPAPRLPGPRCRWPQAAPASSSSVQWGLRSAGRCSRTRSSRSSPPIRQPRIRSTRQRRCSTSAATSWRSATGPSTCRRAALRRRTARRRSSS